MGARFMLIGLIFFTISLTSISIILITQKRREKVCTAKNSLGKKRRVEQDSKKVVAPRYKEWPRKLSLLVFLGREREKVRAAKNGESFFGERERERRGRHFSLFPPLFFPWSCSFLPVTPFFFLFLSSLPRFSSLPSFFFLPAGEKKKYRSLGNEGGNVLKVFLASTLFAVLL